MLVLGVMISPLFATSAESNDVPVTKDDVFKVIDIIGSVMKDRPSTKPKQEKKEKVVLTKEQLEKLLKQEHEKGYREGYKEGLKEGLKEGMKK